MDLAELQDRQQTWRLRNFPDQEPLDGLLGVVEEVGELSHAVLKQKQGIRGYDDAKKARAEIMDAVGDIVIFLAGFCSTNGLDLNECVSKTWDKVETRDWQTNPEGIGHG